MKQWKKIRGWRKKIAPEMPISHSDGETAWDNIRYKRDKKSTKDRESFGINSVNYVQVKEK